MDNGHTINDVQKRYERYEQQLQQVTEQLATIEAEISQKMNTGDGSVGDLRVQRRALQDEKGDIEKALADLQGTEDRPGILAQVSYECAEAEARARLVALKRSRGSKRGLLDKEGAALCDAARALHQQAVAYVVRWESLLSDEKAAGGLADRFGLEPMPVCELGLKSASNHPAVVELRRLLDRIGDVFPKKLHRKHSMEKCEYQLRTRRNYLEITDEETQAILKLVGPRPFPALTPRQQQIVDDQKALKEAEAQAAKEFAQDIADAEEAQKSVDMIAQSPLYRRAISG